MSKLLILNLNRALFETVTYLIIRETFTKRNILHVGMMNKPLSRYDPLAQRSQLPKPTIVMPYKNSS